MTPTAPIFITGADGFIGSHLTEALLLRGHHVRAMALYNAFGTWGWLDQVAAALPADQRDRLEITVGDVRDPHCVRHAMRDCQTVFHLAALIGIPYSYHAPDSYIDTNVKGTLNVVQAGRELGVKRIVHTSTSEVYGTALRVPIDEQHPLQPQSPYSASKIAADHLALSFFHAFGTPVAVCRPFNTFGPRQSNRAVIPTIITQIASGQRRLRLGALTPTRDFNFVTDTVAGFIAIAESDAALGKCVNLGTGFDISIGDTAALIAELMNVKVEIEEEAQRLRPEGSEVQRLQADASLAKKLTGWSPRYAGPDGLRQALKLTIDWFTRPENLRHYKPLDYGI